MNNDPNSINNTPIESLEPEILEPTTEPVQPVPVAPEQLTQPVPPVQPMEKQMGTNPHQHVDMNSLTPRTVFDTEVKEPEPKKQEAPKKDDKPDAPKEKSAAFPLILFILVVAAGGYFLYTQFGSKPAENIYEQPQEEVKKEENEEKEETTEKEETKEETAQQDNNTENNQQSKDIEIVPGTILYLYENNSIGLDKFTAEYISNTDTDIKVRIILNETNSKEYTIKYGEKTSITGLKNQIVITKGSDNFSIEFK